MQMRGDLKLPRYAALRHWPLGCRKENTMLQGLLSMLAAARREARARSEFARLDAAAYRDLGISPSEFGSYWAESQGVAERTRVRVESAAPPDAGSGYRRAALSHCAG
jgi:uncharacterized protein YjiS (DUF1127 family)